MEHRKYFGIAIIFLAVFLPLSSNVQAETTYITGTSNFVENIYNEYANCCSFADNYKKWSFYVKIPVGTEFNRIALNGSSTDNIPISINAYSDVYPPIETCYYDDDCRTGDVNLGQIYSGYGNDIGNGTILSSTNYSFATTTVNSSSTYYLISIAPQGWFYHLDQYLQENNPMRIWTTPTDPTNADDNAITFQVCMNNCDIDFAPMIGTSASTKYININKPTPYGTTTATTTVDFDISYYYNGETGTTTRAEYKIYDAVSGSLEKNVFQLVPSGYDVNFFMQQTFDLATGSKKMIARYVIAGTDQDLIAPVETFFNVIDNSYYLATGMLSPQVSGLGSGLSQIDCDTFDVGCQFQKAIVFLFVPTPATLNKFTTLWNNLVVTVPFGYVNYIYQSFKQIKMGEASFELPAIPFDTAIFTPIKNGISLMLWGIFAVFLYRRFRKIDI